MEAPIKTLETQQLNRTQRKELRKEEARKRRREKLKAAIASLNEPSRREKFNEGLTLISFACTVGSWGWSVVAPDSSILFGSILLFIAVMSMLFAVFRVWPMRKLAAISLVLVVLGTFGAFDWYVVIKPQKGKEFKNLLVDGYHITSECEGIPGTSEMPDWMRDQSTKWQATAEQTISEKLDYKDLQMWRDTIIIGLVADKNKNAYQCLWLANKVGTLENIIATHYDRNLKHQEYIGPTYWLNASNGQVDISEATKNGALKDGKANIYINGGATPSPTPK
jgi:hypothetical protein